MSIASQITALTTDRDNIRTALAAKGISASSHGFDDFAADINSIGGDEELKDVVYFDYDGSIVAQYTKEEFALLTEHPSNPSHAGLTAQGWNWSLADAKTYVSANGALDIGQMYVTDDGKTRLYITLKSGYLEPTLWFNQSVTQGVSVNWGDGSTDEKYTGNGNKSATHTYSSEGNYTITLTPLVGTFTLGGGTQVRSIISKSDNDRLLYSSTLKKIEIGSSCTGPSAYGLYNSQGLETISVPNTFINLTTYAFYGCMSLKFITLPTNLTVITNSNGYFQNNFSLKNISIPRGITTIPAYMFARCMSLRRLVIPSTVTTISANAGHYCYKLERLVIPDSVTSLGSSFRYSNIEKLVIPGTIETITQSCFSDSTIEHIELKNGVKVLEASSFSTNITLKDITLPNTLTTLGNSCLTGCISLVTIDIPSNVTTIGAYAFNGNTFMKSYYFYPTTPPTLGHAANLVFGSIPADCVIYVPAESVEAYKTTGNWNVASIANKIQAMP